jgi:hypothetical protein
MGDAFTADDLAEATGQIDIGAEGDGEEVEGDDDGEPNVHSAASTGTGTDGHQGRIDSWGERAAAACMHSTVSVSAGRTDGQIDGLAKDGQAPSQACAPLPGQVCPTDGRAGREAGRQIDR